MARKTAQPAGQVTITDTVEYSAAWTAGQEYTLEGVLMDKETGEPLLVNDQQVTSEATFTPAEASGTIDVLFTFDASTGLDRESSSSCSRDSLSIGEERKSTAHDRH